MRLEQKLNLWVKNNLIEPSQKQQIMDFEQNRGTPLFFGGMVLLGIFAITLGVISLIAANWEFIPGWVKIFFDIVLLSLIAGGSYYAWSKNHFIWFEAGVFALFMMVGASIGLIGQVFQTNGSFACAGLFWGIITAPLLAISKRRSLPFCWLILFFSSLLNIPAVEELIWHLFNWWFWADHPEVALIAILVHTGIIAACLSMADHLSDYKYPIFSEARWIVYFAMYSSLLFYMVFAAFESKAIYSFNIFFISGIFLGIMAGVGDKLHRPRQVKANIAMLYIECLLIYFRLLGSLVTTGFGLILSGIVLIGGLYGMRKIMSEIKTDCRRNTK